MSKRLTKAPAMKSHDAYAVVNRRDRIRISIGQLAVFLRKGDADLFRFAWAACGDTTEPVVIVPKAEYKRLKAAAKEQS